MTAQSPLAGALDFALGAIVNTSEAAPRGRERLDMGITVKIDLVGAGAPGQLATAELEFTGGVLDGLRLIGFAVWERKDGGLNVTCPARQYSSMGERRSTALLRPQANAEQTSALRDFIVAAYEDAIAVPPVMGNGR